MLPAARKKGISAPPHVSAKEDVMFEKRSDLEKFLCVVETGKIQVAAVKMRTTQPALSRIITKLEEQFGGQLFERIPTGVRPTAFGVRIAQQARHILREIELAEHEVNAATAGRTGVIRITVGTIWLQSVMPQAVREFQQAFPRVEVHMLPIGHDEGLEMLKNGQTDAHCGGFDSEQQLPQFLRREYILDMRLGLIAHANHPLFQQDQISYDDLTDYPWLGYNFDPNYAPGQQWPALNAILAELYRHTDKRVGTILHCGATGFFFMDSAPYLTYTAENFVTRLDGLPLRAVPVEFSPRTFRSGVIFRRSLESTPAFRYFKDTVRRSALRFA